MKRSQRTNRYWALVPAAGSGSRMGADCPKQYLMIEGRTVLEHTLQRLSTCSQLAGIMVVLSPQDNTWDSLTLPQHIAVHTTEGGAERCHSVLNGLASLGEIAAPEDWVLVHDAARPCIRLSDMQRLMDALCDHPVGGLLGVPVSDTVKRTDATATIIETVERDGLWRALTPQMFRLANLQEALAQAIAAGSLVTDEAAAMERAGYAPQMVEGQGDNIKITRPGDLQLAAFFLQQQLAASTIPCK